MGWGWRRKGSSHAELGVCSSLIQILFLHWDVPHPDQPPPTPPPYTHIHTFMQVLNTRYDSHLASRLGGGGRGRGGQSHGKEEEVGLKAGGSGENPASGRFWQQYGLHLLDEASLRLHPACKIQPGLLGEGVQRRSGSRPGRRGGSPR